MNDRDNQLQDRATPEKLRAALSRLNARKIVVPPKVDDVVLQAAHGRLAGVFKEAHVDQQVSSTKPGSNWAEFCAGLLEFFAVRRWAAWGGVAVTMIAVGALVWLGGRTSLTARPEDLNGDGVVDMLDAFALARELQHDPASHPQFDLNGDGVVDERDVQALAARAVSLETGGRS